MTGRQKIEAAMSRQGTPEIPAVICYEGIYIRDHWRQLTSHPWWQRVSPDIEQQMAWRRDVIAKTGQDWMYLPRFYPLAERRNLALDVRSDGVYRVNIRTGLAEKLSEPAIGGWTAPGAVESVHPAHLATSRAEIDALVGQPGPARPLVEPGERDLAARLLDEFPGVFPICHASTPLWCLYDLWGFEGMMTMLAERPDLVRYACQRYLELSLGDVREAAALGARAVWLEECLTDMISPAQFAEINVPLVAALVSALRAAGLYSIYYYCGNPNDRLERLLSVGADALALEEGKKGFAIDIMDIAEEVQGRCTLLGNLDAIHLLEHGSEADLRAEIARQIAAGRRNGSRFIMSIGSPVTPDTPVERVRLYCDLVHELGGATVRP
jgi:hypothetical protein